MSVEFSLATGDRELLLERVPGLNEEVRSGLRFGVVSDEGINFQLSKEAFKHLVEEIEYVTATTDDDRLLPILMELYNYLDDDELDKLEGDWGGLNVPEAAAPVMSMQERLIQEFQQLAEERGIGSLEEAQALLQEVTARQNAMPVAEFDGLSPDQMGRILYYNWDAPESFISLRSDIPPAMLQDNNMLDNALLIMGKMHEAGEVKATTAGNLNRAFVDTVRRELKGYENYYSDREDGIQRWNEEDVLPLMTLRWVLLGGGLIRKVKGRFKLTRRGEKMLAQGASGALLAAMFAAYYQKLNIAAADHFAECDVMQHAIGYTFLMLKRYASDWTTLEELKPRLFAPFVWDEMPVRSYAPESYWRTLASVRVIAPLARFGLLQLDSKEKDCFWCDEDTRLRTTPLFDAFIEFRMG